MERRCFGCEGCLENVWRTSEDRFGFERELTNAFFDKGIYKNWRIIIIFKNYEIYVFEFDENRRKIFEVLKP